MNKKALGMFEDAACGKQLAECVKLWAKLYSYKMFEREEKKKCQGVKERFQEKHRSWW